MDLTKSPYKVHAWRRKEEEGGRKEEGRRRKTGP